MIDRGPAGHADVVRQEALALTVGCEFALASAQPSAAIMQVAPRRARRVDQRERWETAADHHGYVDTTGIAASGSSSRAAPRIAYEAEVVLARPADLIEPDA